jgi:superfamily II DNA or RNA helicase
MGSGKTLSAISALEDARQKDPDSMLRVLTPASLRENFRKEVEKHTDEGITGGTPQPKSHTKATMEGPQDEKADMRVVDEAHRARSTGSKFKKRLRETPAEKNLLMTGTPVYNHPHEISPLVNISAGENLLPETKSRFETKYVREEEEYPGGLSGLAYRVTGGTPGIKKKLETGKESLREPLRQYVDYYEPDRDNENYPDVEEEEVKVPMSKRQKDAYRYMFKDLPMHLRWKVQSNLPPDKDERGKMMKFLNGPRQVATSINAFDEDASDLEAGQDSPKIQEVAEAVDDSSKRQVVYSNFLESGLDPLRAVLDEKGVDYGEYTGSTSQSKREEDVRRFNEGELSTLVMSSAGGEGLDLDAVNEIHVMEPHWNEQKINQVVARADRYKSHEGLPEEERQVDVKRYVSELPEKSVSNAVRSVFGGDKTMTGSVEEYIQGLAKEKQELSDQLIELLEEETEKAKGEAEKEASLQSQLGLKGGIRPEKTAAPDTIMSAVSKLRDQVYGDLDLDKEELRDLARRAEEEAPDQDRLKNLFGEQVRLHGSMGLGINVPGEDSDIDVTIPTSSDEEYQSKIEEVREKFTDLESSPYNRFRDGVYVMSGTVDGDDMDVVVGHGPHVDERVESFDRANEELTPEDRGRIIGEKKRLKDAYVLAKPRYKQYKREVDNKLDIPRL